MDHDALPSELGGPTSARIADVRDFSAEFTRRGLRAFGERIGVDADYESNRSGHLAWDVSLLIRAACLTWRVTNDPEHLEQALCWARHLVDRTDAATGTLDWRGRSEPIWSAGTRYTAGRAVVGAVGGVPVHLQGAADRVIIERPSATTAVIRVVGGDGSVWSCPEASLLPDQDDYLPDVLARRSTTSAVLLRGLPASSDLTWLQAGEHRLEPQLAAHLVHTGLIARSLLSVAQALESAEPRAVNTDFTPADLRSAAEDALLAHDGDVRVRRGRAWYCTPADFPGRRLGLALPHNHVVDAATSFLVLGRLHDDDDLYGLGRSLTRPFLSEIHRYQTGALAQPWHYYPVDSDIYVGVTREEPLAERCVRAVPRAEDSSHATVRVRALGEWKAVAPELVPDDALSALALSFRRHFLTRRNKVATLRWLPGEDGGQTRQSKTDVLAGAWAALSPWDATLRRRLNGLIHRHPPTAALGATVLSSAEMLALDCGFPTGASRNRNARG